jgi:hypothetical protein
MRSPTRILEILRDFVEVDRLVRGLAQRHRAHGLRFPELAALIRDDESSVLFRLKERTHAVFRGPGGVVRGSTARSISGSTRECASSRRSRDRPRTSCGS